MYCHAFFCPKEWLNFGDEKDICSALFYSVCVSVERSNPNHAESYEGLDCTEVRFRKSIIAFALLLYRKF